MFCGTSEINLDSKGRLSVPTRYRDFFTDGLVCTIGLQMPCLAMYAMDEWENIAKKMSKLSSTIAMEKRISRLILGHAEELTLDSAGRVLLPNVLRRYAKLEKQIVFVGQGNKFELWANDIWNEQIVDDLSSLSLNETELTDNLKDLTL